MNNPLDLERVLEKMAKKHDSRRKITAREDIINNVIPIPSKYLYLPGCSAKDSGNFRFGIEVKLPDGTCCGAAFIYNGEGTAFDIKNYFFYLIMHPRRKDRENTRKKLDEKMTYSTH